ncbi:zinc finger protein 385B-like isoform X2 [Lycorma delicatula]
MTEQMSVTTIVHPSPNTMDHSQTSTHIDTNDPVTKAVVDNIVGNLPSKKPQVKLSCEICNIQVLGQNIMEEHLAGAKHARKVKSLELMKEMQNMISDKSSSSCLDLKNNTYTCRPCNVIVNSIQQLQVHCQGSKHKSKVSSSDNGSISNGDIQKGDAMSSRFYCSTCNVRVNSDTQLEQHKMSKKHSGRAAGSSDMNNRSAPYFKSQRKVFVKEGWTGNMTTPFPAPGTEGSLRCNVCNVSANSALQLQQHNFSRKHKEKLGQKGCEPMETQQQPSLQPPPFIKKEWINPQNDLGSYSYAPAGPGGGGGYNAMNVYTPKWSGPSFQRSQHGGYNRY